MKDINLTILFNVELPFLPNRFKKKKEKKCLL